MSQTPCLPESLPLAGTANTNTHEPPTLRGRPSALGVGVWTASEHRRFREAERLYPHGPWRRIAAYVATRTIKQTVSHAHKCRERHARHCLGLRPPGRKRRSQQQQQHQQNQSTDPSPSSGSSSDSSGSESEAFAMPECGDVLDDVLDDIMDEHALAEMRALAWALDVVECLEVA